MLTLAQQGQQHDLPIRKLQGVVLRPRIILIDLTEARHRLPDFVMRGNAPDIAYLGDIHTAGYKPLMAVQNRATRKNDSLSYLARRRIIASTSPARTIINAGWRKSGHRFRRRQGGRTMRTVIPFTEIRNFDPETIHLMGTAFESAWGSLTTTGDRLATPLMAGYSRELLARRILELAQRGERNPIRLSDDALDYLKGQPAGARPKGSTP